MKIAHSHKELKEALLSLSGRVAFVPTMGALHAGHLSLIKLAHTLADNVVVSVFVNPTQFAPHEDFDAYPRDLNKDANMLEAEGVAIVYAPSEADMYPEGAAVSIRAGDAAKGLESDFRPHFFDGVVTVVHRLFDRVQPDVAVFGEKDFQQLQVIREMVAAHNMDIEIAPGPIVRDKQGLALSSRNAYLSEEELEIARMLNQAMYKAAQNPNDAALKEAEQMLLNAGFDKVDYVSYRPEWTRVLVAAWLGKTRLIDNCAVTS